MSESESEKKQKQKKANAPVLNYIILLFVAAFSLLLMTYLMEQRETAEVIDGIRTSVSAMQSVEEVYGENQSLMEENWKLESEVEDLLKTQSNLEKEVLTLENQEQKSADKLLALESLWDLQEAVDNKDTDRAVELLIFMEEEELSGSLREINDRFQQRYEEIFLLLEEKMAAYLEEAKENTEES